MSALIVTMIDNPLCAITGHRICNDCMQSCIFQKQEPVDTPSGRIPYFATDSYIALGGWRFMIYC